MSTATESCHRRRTRRPYPAKASSPGHSGWSAASSSASPRPRRPTPWRRPSASSSPRARAQVAGHHDAGLRPDVLHRGRLQGAQRGGADCGTTFTWATRAFGPVVGWMGGWGIVIADVIVMANLAQIAGAYSFTLANELGIHNSLRLEHVLVDGGRAGLDRPDDVDLLPRDRGLGAPAVRPARHRDRHPRRSSPSSPWSRCMPGTRRPGPSTRRCPGCGRAVCRYRVDLPRPCCSPCSSTGAGTPPSRPTRRLTTRAGPPGGPPSSPPSCCCSPTSWSPSAAVSFAGIGDKGIGLGNADNADDVFGAIGPTLYGNLDARAHRAGPARDHDPHLGVGVDPDDDPADRPDHPVDGGLQGDPGEVRPDPPAVPHPDLVDDRHGRRLGGLLPADDPDQPEHPVGADRARSACRSPSTTD